MVQQRYTQALPTKEGIVKRTTAMNEAAMTVPHQAHKTAVSRAFLRIAEAPDASF